MELTLSLCTLKNLDTLIAIGKRTFTESFQEQNNPDDFSDYLESAFSKATILSELKDPNTSFYFVYRGTIKVGYFKINKAASQTDIKDDNAIELERIYVLKEHQGQRIGNYILNWVMDYARSKNKRYVWLGVWERNAKAIDFYRRYGFVKFGTHPYYIGKDRQTDWLMRYDL